MKVLLVSLGCDKNRVDSEHMLGLIREAGHAIVDDETEAEVIIVNSCCFIGDAKEESINTILEMAELKTTAKLKKLIVTGCLAQRYHEDIKNSIPEVDCILGTMAIEDIVTAINSMDSDSYLRDINYLPCVKAERIITGESYVAYLKIAEGCGKHCTYCVIPSVRGDFRSYPMEQLVAEAKYLAENGCRELILVAQETTLYGTDIYGHKALHELLIELSRIEDLKWIRLMYAYPEEIYDELLDTMNKLDKVVKYIDLPIQHASDKILKTMGRRTTKKELIKIIKNIRKRVPGVALRTSLIAGFPGETEDDVKELMEFLEMVRIERVGTFTYSREEGTPAGKMKNQIPAREKKKRRNQIMKLCSEISLSVSKSMVGKELDILVEGYMPEDEVYIGRSYMDAPEVDGRVFFISDEKLMSGDVVKVSILDAKKYDLLGEALYESTK